MSELRLMLLVAGVVLILGIYLYSRRVQSKSTARNAERRAPSFTNFVSDSDAVPPLREPHTKQPTPELEFVDEVVGPATVVTPKTTEPRPESTLYEQADLPLPEELRPEVQDMPAGKPSGDDAAGKKREKVIVINVSAKGSSRFAGPAIVDALTAESLEFGEFGIFHRRNGPKSLFSVASMVEPGRFDMDNIDQLSTPGLSLFLLLPGPDSPVGAFTEMLSTARRLATALDGDVLDESGSTLSRQAASHLREQIIEFAHRIR